MSRIQSLLAQRTSAQGSWWPDGHWRRTVWYGMTRAVQLPLEVAELVVGHVFRSIVGQMPVLLQEWAEGRFY